MGTARTDFEMTTTSVFMRDQKRAMDWQQKRQEALRKALNSDLKRLVKITKECREDMHEPDEAEITAFVEGKNLDNAFGDEPRYNHGELTVCINKGCGKKMKREWFNLATLIALARKANI